MADNNNNKIYAKSRYTVLLTDGYIRL